MVGCICINDKGKPKKTLLKNWVKEGESYTVVFATYVLPQKQLSFQLKEVEPPFPYEYFLADRFRFTEDGLKKLTELLKDCNSFTKELKKIINERTAATDKEN